MERSHHHRAKSAGLARSSRKNLASRRQLDDTARGGVAFAVVGLQAEVEAATDAVAVQPPPVVEEAAEVASKQASEEEACEQVRVVRAGSVEPGVPLVLPVKLVACEKLVLVVHQTVDQLELGNDLL